MKNITRLLMNSTLVIILFGIFLLPAVTTGIVRFSQESTSVLSATDEVQPTTAETPQVTPAPHADAAEILETIQTSESTESFLTPEDEMPTFSDIQNSN